MMARAQDDELAVQIIDEIGIDNLPENRTPPLQGWSAEVREIANLQDLVKELTVAVYATDAKRKKGAKPPKLKPVARPRVAMDRARGNVARRKHVRLVSEAEEAQARRRERAARNAGTVGHSDKED